MNYHRLSDGEWAIKLTPGDIINDSILAFATSEGIKGGFLQGIGAVASIELGYFDREIGEYRFQRLDGDFEMLSVVGNLTTSGSGERILHIHGIFGKDDLSLVGGHIKSAVVSVTGEFYFREGELPHRMKDSATGLMLWE